MADHLTAQPGRVAPRRVTRTVLARSVLAVLTVVLVASCGSSTATTPAGGQQATPPPPAAHPIFGVDYSPYTRPGEAPQAPVPDSRIRAQLQELVGKVLWIKVVGTGGGLANIPRIAHGMGLKVAEAAVLTPDAGATATEIRQLEDNVRNGYVDIALVGSETVFTNTLPAAAVVRYMNQVRSDLGGRVPVSTVEPARDPMLSGKPTLLQYTSLIHASDVVFANITPFSYKLGLEESLASLKRTYQAVVRAAGGKRVYIGETEWATEGGPFGAAVASPQNAATYFKLVEDWARANDVGVFYFEAFDEPWLTAGDAKFGPHWGIFTGDGTLKPGFDVVFAGG